jgi:hypothetical protein
MSTSVYLSNPVITINSVSSPISAQVQLLTMFTSNLKPPFGDTARKYGASTITSLQNNTIEVELYQSYAATETEATIFGLVGITCDVVVAPASGIASATNPIFTLSGCYLESHSPINASLGELSSISLVFAGGNLTKAVA